jgi:hypothetical protein
LMFLFLYSCLMHQVRVRYKRTRYFSYEKYVAV